MKTLLSMATLTLALSQGASAMVVNGDFESGMDGWDGIGVGGAFLGVGFTASMEERFFGDFDVSDSEVENFLGLGAGTLDGLSSGNAVEGSALKQSIEVQAGDVLTFDFLFATAEEPGSDYNDFAFFSVSGASSDVLADTNSPFSDSIYVPFIGTISATDWQTTTYEFLTGGVYTIGFGVMNVDDDLYGSAMLLDNVGLNVQSANVPEPSTIGLLAIGLVGLGLARKRLS